MVAGDGGAEKGLKGEGTKTILPTGVPVDLHQKQVDYFGVAGGAIFHGFDGEI